MPAFANSLKECSFQFHGKCPVGSHRSRLKTLFSGKYLIKTMSPTVKLRSRVYGPNRNRMVGLGPLPLSHRERAENSGHVRQNGSDSDMIVCPHKYHYLVTAEMRKQACVWSREIMWPLCHMASVKSLKTSSNYNTSDREHTNKCVIPSNVKTLRH